MGAFVAVTTIRNGGQWDADLRARTVEKRQIPGTHHQNLQGPDFRWRVMASGPAAGRLSCHWKDQLNEGPQSS